MHAFISDTHLSDNKESGTFYSYSKAFSKEKRCYIFIRMFLISGLVMMP